MKKVFVAATRQNDGKTMVSLGLLQAFQKRFAKVSYMKPVGQQYKVINGKKIDKDAVLMQQTFNLPDNLEDMSPIAIPKGFTETFIEDGGDATKLATRIKTSFDRLQSGNDVVLVEGTGHAGVGSVFNMGNADVAKLLGAKVILVSIGGIGKAIDELMLNKASFDLQGVEILGVILNKVYPDKYDKISEISRKGLAQKGLKVLGVIPLIRKLTYPHVSELVDDLKAEVLSGENALNNIIEKFIIGDMLPHNALDAFSTNTLLIVPGNQEGLILTALLGNLIESKVIHYVSAIIFTNGIRPHDKFMNLIKRTNVPLLLVNEDSFTIASRINNMIFKLRSQDTDKISEIDYLINTYVDVDGIIKEIS